MGLRQIYDISIDKVNKPFLPVASGEMSVQFAWVAVRQLCSTGVASKQACEHASSPSLASGACARRGRRVHRDLQLRPAHHGARALASAPHQPVH